MEFKSDRFFAAGGTIGGQIVWTRRDMMIMRNYVIPQYRNTPALQVVRDILTAVAHAWSTQLTQHQRDGWEQFGRSLVLVSKIGQEYDVCGFNAFVMCNAARLLPGLPRVDWPPLAQGFDDFTPVAVRFLCATQEVEIDFENHDPWARETGGALSVRICPLWFSPAVTFYEGPFVYLGCVLGSTLTPPTSPVRLPTVPYLYQGGQYAVVVRSLRADARVSLPVITRGIAVW